jgi:23S rRNA (uracil1939-C5)-methyltransferase
MAPLNANDETQLRGFADRHNLHIYLQPAGPDSAYRFHPAEGSDPFYTLPEFNLTLAFGPTDFTQINQPVNRALVRRAMQLLRPSPGERIADIFCGLGNFTLAIARSGAQVFGLEGSEKLVERAKVNALRNGLENNTQFSAVNLFKADLDILVKLGPFDKVLIDPPRDGAVEVIRALQENLPQRIVYISCNPATLARDAGVLVHTKNYALRSIGVINMFPHTTHIESIALFDRNK